MPKSRNSAVMEKCQKVACPRSRKNAKKSSVHGYEKMLKTRRSAVREKYKNILRSAVMQKCLKLACLLSQNDIKNAKNSLCGHVKTQKMLSSGVMQKCLTRRSMVTKKCQKVAGPPSRKNAKKSQVRCHRKMPKSRSSAVMEKCQKLTGPRSWKNTKNA